MNRLLYSILLLCIGIIWGITILVSPYSISQMGTGLFLMSRFMAAYLVISIIYRGHLKHISFHDISRGIILGCILFVFILIQARALQNGAVLNYTRLLVFSCAVIPVLTMVIMKQRPSIVEISAIILSCAGGICLGMSLRLEGVAGLLLLALYVALTCSFVRKSRAEFLAAVQLAVATLCSLPLIGRDLVQGIDLQAWLILLFVSFAATAGAVVFLTKALSIIPAAKSGCILLTQVCVVELICIYSGMNPVDSRMTLGIVLICIGCSLCLLPFKNPLSRNQFLK